jgi:hypothetical protein
MPAQPEPKSYFVLPHVAGENRCAPLYLAIGCDGGLVNKNFCLVWFSLVSIS